MCNKVVGYGRVSTQSQIDGTGPEEQEQSIEAECKKRGYKFLKFYSDLAYSGSDDNRPELQKLIADAKLGMFQTVMCTKIDRLGRNLRDLKNILHELSKSGLTFIFVQQPELSSNGMYGELLLNMLGAISEFERSMIKDRCDRGRIRRWKEGNGAIGSLPLGYTRANGKIEIDSEGAKVYQKIAAMYLYENYSFRDIAIKLTSEGIATPSGRSKKWHNVTISDILKNPAYTGKAIQNQFEFVKKRSMIKGRQYYCVSKDQKPPEVWISITYPPLITKDKYDQIQAKTEHQKRKPKKHHVGYENHFLAENILFCGYCGSRMKKRITPSGKISYCCYWWEASDKERQMHQKDKCKLKYEDAEYIDGMITNEIVKLLSNPGRFAKDWFKDVDLEELKKKVECLRKRGKELKSRLTEGFKKIKNTPNPELRKIYLLEIQKDEKDFEENQDTLREAGATLEFSQNKYNRLEEFNKAMNYSKVKACRAWYSAQGQFSKFFYDLPFQEKKRIVESIVSPESGGKILIRYGTKAEESEGEIVFEMNFDMDLNRIEALINSLNKRILLDNVTTRRAAGVP